MFTTYRHAEIPLAPVFGDHYQLWRFVELEQHRPWFCVTVNKGKNGATWRTMLLISTEEELELMLRELVVEAQIEAVQVVTPARLNGTGEWQIEQLAELVRVFDSNKKVAGYDFKTASGAIYSERGDSATRDADRTRIY
ncbi:hypothetical protein [Aquipseudomonas alcaligenes]|uniref:hypothetical protein n=1 Tax=Aquipseudomonas alcaligenes TaxID=43263 RepID=UPI00242D6558|nr:hypothetical protein [Pseudomonas alcaligenes]